MKILVSDFDNTFYTMEYNMNIEAIKEFVKNDGIFIIATGRNLNQLLNDLDGYNVPVSYYICNDGSLIYDKNFKLLYRKDIKQELVKPIFEVLDKSKFYRETLIDSGEEYILDCNHVCNKIVSRPKEYNKAKKEFEELLNQYSDITGYFSENWLNIVDVSVNKGRAIQVLQLQNNWLTDDIYTIGDNVNDITMSTMYRGYAMEDGYEELKKVSIGTVKNIRELIQIIEKEK